MKELNKLEKDLGKAISYLSKDEFFSLLNSNEEIIKNHFSNPETAIKLLRDISKVNPALNEFTEVVINTILFDKLKIDLEYIFSMGTPESIEEDVNALFETKEPITFISAMFCYLVSNRVPDKKYIELVPEMVNSIKEMLEKYPLNMNNATVYNLHCNSVDLITHFMEVSKIFDMNFKDINVDYSWITKAIENIDIFELEFFDKINYGKETQ